MAVDAQQLQQRVETPRERLDVELKAWLDLSDNGLRGTLAKGLIALANHGGGVAIIGFDTDGNPAPSRPGGLAAYSQDAVNDIVDRFADPVFHCTEHLVTRVADGLQYPVILVPGGHKVPIRSKRGDPNNEISSNRYYVRRPRTGRRNAARRSRVRRADSTLCSQQYGRDCLSPSRCP